MRAISFSTYSWHVFSLSRVLFFMHSSSGAASDDSLASSEALQLAELARQLSDLQSFVSEGLVGLEGHWTARSDRLESEILAAVTELHERVDSIIRQLRGIEVRLQGLEGRGENTDPLDLESLD